MIRHARVTLTISSSAAEYSEETSLRVEDRTPRETLEGLPSNDVVGDRFKEKQFSHDSSRQLLLNSRKSFLVE